MRDRMKEIKAKGFNMFREIEPAQETLYQNLLEKPTEQKIVDYNSIKVGPKTLEDAVMKFGDLRKANPNLADKDKVLRAIKDYDLKTMREISNYFYRTSGIYARILRYMAFMYRYDWYVTPYVNDEKVKQEKLLDGFHKCLSTLDNFEVKKTLGEIALKVLKNGAYYGYKVKCKDSFVLQELPPNYCRSRLDKGNKPTVEFNMAFFDEMFRNTEQRMRALKLFPEEFAKGYIKYKKGLLPPVMPGDKAGWYLLDPEMTVKFTANGEEYPAFISVIPLIIDLDEAQALDRKKTMQRLLKIVVQKMPMDKNGELIFDMDEMRALHNNAVQMLGRAMGIDVLTTFADVTVEDLSDNNASNQTDDLQRVERQLYNEAGVSQMQFNTDGNIALEKSILNDEATMYNMLLQFEDFLNDLIAPYNTNVKKVEYRAQILTTTIYNYKDLAKLYKEQTQLGYSKMLPQIALGQTQSSVLANAYFENEILNLIEVFIPPMSSNVMNADMLDRATNKKSAEAGAKDAKAASGDGTSGRPEKPDDEKSTKTLQNKESAN